jgi:hypothetical protein
MSLSSSCSLSEDSDSESEGSLSSVSGSGVDEGERETGKAGGTRPKLVEVLKLGAKSLSTNKGQHTFETSKFMRLSSNANSRTAMPTVLWPTIE